jgi:UDP-2,4-diacetamido-2,4,6-trideoxy-beta-L-altropyranose hydrolase
MVLENRLKIVVRVDSGNRIGMGHITESLSLLKSLEEYGIEALFLTRDYPSGIKKIENSGYAVKVIPAKNDFAHDIDIVLDTAREFQADALIVDLLRVKRVDEGAVIINDIYLKKLSGRDFILAAIFDDTVLEESNADLFINFHICQDPSFYTGLMNRDKYCIGPEYMLLDADLCGLREKTKEISKDCRNIFINQGGSDPYGLTSKILRAMKSLKVDAAVNIVTGGGIKKEFLEEVNEIACSSPSNYKFYFDISSSCMLEWRLPLPVIPFMSLTSWAFPRWSSLIIKTMMP